MNYDHYAALTSFSRARPAVSGKHFCQNSDREVPKYLQLRAPKTSLMQPSEE